MDFAPWAMSCGLFCLMPMFVFWLGTLVGSRKVVIRLPVSFSRNGRDPIGYSERK